MSLIYLCCILVYKKRMKNRTRVPEAMQSVEELMETPTFKRFNTAIDTVLELAEDMDLAEFNKGIDNANIFDHSYAYQDI